MDWSVPIDLVIFLVGLAVSYGILQMQVRQNKKEIEKIDKSKVDKEVLSHQMGLVHFKLDLLLSNMDVKWKNEDLERFLQSYTETLNVPREKKSQ